MATGYTARIESGASFEEFVLGCAGLDLHDEPGHAHAHQSALSCDYHLVARKKAVAEFARIKAMTNKECKEAAEKEYLTEEKYKRDAVAKNRSNLEKYSKMLEQVNAWTPPTGDHQNLKDFMIKQIDMSIKYILDFQPLAYCEPMEKPTFSVSKWKKKRLTKIAEEIAYRTKAYGEELDSAKKRSLWIQQLFDSLA